MRLPVKSPELFNVFIEASRNLERIFTDNQGAKEIENHRRI
jgi:hypothetical protein